MIRKLNQIMASRITRMESLFAWMTFICLMGSIIRKISLALHREARRELKETIAIIKVEALLRLKVTYPLMIVKMRNLIYQSDLTESRKGCSLRP